MKNIRLNQFMVVAFGLLFAMCGGKDGKDSNQKEKDSLRATPDKLEFTADDAGKQSVTVNTSAKSWNATQSVDWLIIGKEADKFTVAVEKNKAASSRTGKITVSAGAAEAVIITVTQLAGDEAKPASPDWANDPNLRELKAFPGAEGFGAAAYGGRGGRVLYVTRLDDDNNPGSFRWAVGQSGPRTVMFNVSGRIRLNSRISISNGDLTVAGHSAPGDGICISDYSVVVNASNVIIRYMRFRMGDEKNFQDDALWGRYQTGVIVDHCSMSWSTDECASFYENENFTLQWCILSESLRISVHDKGAHGYGCIWGGKRASFHHNLLAHHDSRNPRFAAYTHNNANRKEDGLTDFRNNAIFNWGGNSGYGGEGGRYNMVNNYYQPGEASRNNARIVSPDPDAATGIYGTFYVAGNMMMNPNGTVNQSVTNDNWLGVHPNANIQNPGDLKSAVEFEKGAVTTHTAREAYELILSGVGASYKRDAIDTRIIREVRNRETPVRASGGGDTRAGLIDSQTDVGGWCLLESLPAPPDTDSDGMPDEWEIANGLNPNDPSDGASTSLSGGTYTGLEVYLYNLLLKK